MTDSPKSPGNTAAQPDAVEVPSPGRRRLLQAGISAPPVLMTLVSRPVLAQVCPTPSGYVSINASTAGRGVATTGRKPAYWISQTTWPSGGNPIAKPLNSCFFKNFFASNPNSYYGNLSLLEVLKRNAASTNPPYNSRYDDVAPLIVAALLNVRQGLTTCVTETLVKNMWNEYFATQYFTPTSNASWNQAELIDYLRLTMPL